MHYRVVFAAAKVGQSDCPPFELDVPDQLGVATQTADLQRRIREHIVGILAAAPAPGASDATPVLAANTQVIADLHQGRGSAHYGVHTLGNFDIYPIH